MEKLIIEGISRKKYDFTQIPLSFKRDGNSYPLIFADVFSGYKNKTLKEALLNRRYRHLSNEVLANHANSMNLSLGAFLLNLKNDGDCLYKSFLNEFGDAYYSRFGIANPEYFNQRGVYAYSIGSDIKYIGRCQDNMKKRVNSGYGNISPKNCYIDGQSTNCRLNNLITQGISNISLWICRIDMLEDIIFAEVDLIHGFQPMLTWNIKIPSNSLCE